MQEENRPDFNQKRLDKSTKGRGWCTSLIFFALFIALLTAGIWLGAKYLKDNGYLDSKNQENVEDSQNEEQTDESEEQDNEEAKEPIKVEVVEIAEKPLQKVNFKKVGTIFPKKSITVIAESQGTLSDFDVDEGDSVKKGQILGQIGDSISTNIAKINYETALKNVELAKQSLANTKSSVAQDINSAGIGVSTAQVSYDNAVKSYNDLVALLDEQSKAATITVQGAELALSSAQDSYYDSLNSHELTFNNTLDQVLTGVLSSLSLVDGALDAADGVLGQRNNVSNAVEDALDEYVSNSHINNVKDDFDDIEDEYEELLDDYNRMKNSQNSDAIKQYLAYVNELLDDTENLLLDTKEIIDDVDLDDYENYLQNEHPDRVNEIIEIEGVLSGSENIINNMFSPISQSKNGLHQGIQAVNGALVQYQGQSGGTFNGMEMAEQQLAAARQSLNITEASQNSQLSNALNGVEMAQEQLKSANSQKKSIAVKGDLQVTGAESQVAMAESQLKIAEENLGGTEIKAPMKGIILEKFVEEGNIVNPSQKVITVGDMGTVKVIVSVTQEELQYIKLGQTVKIILPNSEIEQGKVTKVSASLDAMSKKIDIEIHIDNKQKGMISGMFIEVLFEDAEKDFPSLTVPFKSIIFDAGKSYVYVVQDDKKVYKREVVLGEISQQDVVIVSGLKKGDTIVTQGAKLLEEGDYVSF